MHIIIFFISVLILCSINLTNCQGQIFPTSPLTLTTVPPPPPTVPTEFPTSAGLPEPSQATFPNNSISSAVENAANPQPSAIVVLSTTTTYVGPAATTLSPTETVVAYATVNHKSSCNKILLNLWNIGIFNIISTMALWFN